MKHGLSCGPSAYCARMWLIGWMQTFGDGLLAEQETPLLLTRGWWAGAQRFGGVLWSSDIFSTFTELKAQVPEGISASMSGIPWWTTGTAHPPANAQRLRLCVLTISGVCADIGGFGCPTSPHADNSTYMQELMVRWYQFGAFCPIMRTHGCRAGVSPEPTPFPKECSVGQVCTRARTSFAALTPPPHRVPTGRAGPTKYGRSARRPKPS